MINLNFNFFHSQNLSDFKKRSTINKRATLPVTEKHIEHTHEQPARTHKTTQLQRTFYLFVGLQKDTKQQQQDFFLTKKKKNNR